MAKNPQIKPLTTNARVLTWICICPVEANTSKKRKLTYIIFTFTLFLTVLTTFISSYVFFKENFSNDIEKSFYALLQLIVYLGLTYVILSIFLSRHKITAFLKTLSDIYEAGIKKEHSCAFKICLIY